MVFDKDEETGKDISYMLNKKTRRVIKMVRTGNVWIIEAIVDANTIGEESFARRG